MNKNNEVYKCTIEDIDGVKHFFVTFSDIYCHTQTVEITEDVYEAFQEFNKQEKRQNNHFDRYIEHAQLSDSEIYKRAFAKSSTADDHFLTEELNTVLYRAFDSLTGNQRKRAILYFEHKLTYKQIAELENRSFDTIRESIQTAKQKIINQIEKYLG